MPRRASALRRMLVSSDKLSNDPMNVIYWVNMFALAVNEENAAGGRVWQLRQPTVPAVSFRQCWLTMTTLLNRCLGHLYPLLYGSGRDRCIV